MAPKHTRELVYILAVSVYPRLSLVYVGVSINLGT